MAKQQKAPAPVRVYPAPEMLARGEYLAGVGIDGAEVPADLAAEWQAAGLATRRRPAARRAAAAAPPPPADVKE